MKAVNESFHDAFDLMYFGKAYNLMEKYLQFIDDNREMWKACSDFIFDHPEMAFLEKASSAYQADLLEQNGFTVTRNLKNIETAFAARFGAGHPVVGFLGEFDALFGLSQEPGNPVRAELIPGGPGHGCGHNYLGTADLMAAMAVKNYLEETHHPGTVIYFGCCAEENEGGKAFLARDGAFDELDFAISWHPATENFVRRHNSLSFLQQRYEFDGLASHAGGAPEKGRSALDAVALMNTGVQYLREHIDDATRIHYAITDTGGYSPNVVQPHAEVLYVVRAVNNEAATELSRRVDLIADGAALMTETTVKKGTKRCMANLVLNETLSLVMQKNLESIPIEKPSKEDEDFAREIMKTFVDAQNADYAHPIHYEPSPLRDVTMGRASTDVGDVSWICPTVQMFGATWAYGTPNHSWQVTAQGKWDYGQKEIRYVGKVLAKTAVDVFEHPEILEKAWAEHRENVGPNGYQCGLSKEDLPVPSAE